MNILQPRTFNFDGELNRRQFVKFGATALLALCGTSNAEVSKQEMDEFYLGDRTIWLARGNKTLKTTYHKNGFYIRSAYEEICYLLKDIHENIAVKMDPSLFDVISFSQKWFLISEGIQKPFIASSGYRAPQTNGALENASRLSKHLEGKAIDGGIQGVSNHQLGVVADRVGGGGIGIYPTHTHIDTGRKRHWFA